MKIDGNVPGSFRDPSGFLFFKDGKIYRQVNINYKENYDLLMSSGLYESLVNAELLIPHVETDIRGPLPEKAYKIIQPELIPFVSYPYEWSFSQLKHAALATLKIQKKALDFGMSLKDCSAYNIQFWKSKLGLIDTLSFEKYQEDRPWVAYRQFCQHFLGPLTLISYKKFNLHQLLRIHIDGIPLDLTSSLLPFRTYFRFSLLTHIHLHAKSQKRYEDRVIDRRKAKMSRRSILGLVDNLECAVKKLWWKVKDSEWGQYYDEINYSEIAFGHKKQVLSEFLDQIKPESVWDLGANVGIFSRIASAKGIPVISFDKDQVAVEKNYLQCVSEAQPNIIPLVLDLTNPSPSIGWGNKERMSLIERGPTDMVLFLALIHHLSISNNVPFDRIASFLQRLCNFLVIEFIPKTDSQIQRLLSTREDIFSDYDQENFEREFGKFFFLQTKVKIADSKRILYLMRRRQH